jgi:hypothetical protein
LTIEVVEVLEVTSGQEIVLDVGKGALDPAFSVGMADPVGAEPEAKGAAKASISGAMTASAPAPAASKTLVLSMMQTGQTPSMKRAASSRNALASKRVNRG